MLYDQYGSVHIVHRRKMMYGDTASSCHLDNDDTGMHYVVDIHDCVSGIGVAVIVTKKGKKCTDLYVRMVVARLSSCLH